MKRQFLIGMTFVGLWLSTMSQYASAGTVTCAEPEWDEACFIVSPSGRTLKQKYLKRVKFQANGFAVLTVGPFESVAINRKGDVVIPGIVSGDFDYTESEDGVAAFYTKNSKGEKSKCGYFQVSNFQVVIPPTYDICSRFLRDKAHVCRNCELDCVDCHNYEYYGEEGFVINKKNEIIRRLPLSKLPRCSTVEMRGGFPKDQQCRPDSNHTAAPSE